MLSRHASSLYWLGRYQERTEFLSRYLEVAYFSTVDSSMNELRNFTLNSMMYMATGNPSKGDTLDDREVIWEIALNDNSENSIISYVNWVRENAKSVRNLISNELWETVNKNYHFVQTYDAQYLKSRGLFEFTTKIQDNAAVFESKLNNTLLHDEPWRFVMLGIYMERAYQILRIINNTILDIESLKSNKDSSAIENFYWSVTLSVLEAADMTRKIFSPSAFQSNACEFLITSIDFPRSIAYSLEKIQSYIKELKGIPDNTFLQRNSVEYRCSKLSSEIKYLNFQIIKGEIPFFLKRVLEELSTIHNLIYEDFFERKI